MARRIARRLGLMTVPAVAAGLLLATPMAAGAYGPVGDIATGINTDNVVFSADGQTAWVTNRYSNSVSRIDVDGNQEVEEITVGTQPIGLSLTPDGSELWVGNWGGIDGADITIVDTADSTTTTISSEGSGAWDIEFDASGASAYVTNYFTNQIVRIDTATRTVVDSQSFLGTNPQGLTMSPDGLTLYAAMVNVDSVFRVSPATLDQIGDAILVDDFPVDIEIIPDTGEVWVTNNGDGTVSVIDPVTHLVTDTIITEGSPRGITVDVDGFVWVAAESDPEYSFNTLRRIDPVTHEVVSSQDFPVFLRGTQAHPTERIVYVAAGDGIEIVALTPIRVAGANRYETAVDISEAAFADPSAVSTVYVAAGTNYPDALGAGPVAAKVGAPVLLTRQDALPPVVADEITRLDPESIVLIGATGSVSTAVEDALNAIAPTTRIAGANRYATGRALVASQFGAGSADAVYLASGINFPDALSGGGAAANGDDPLILVNGTQASLDAATLDLIASIAPTDVHILGGTSSVSGGIQSQLAGLGYDITRYAGANRYETSRLVNEAAFEEASYAVFATGATYPDALAGTAFAGVYNAPVYLVRTDCVPPLTLGELDRLSTAWVAVLGGPSTISDNALNLGACAA